MTGTAIRFGAAAGACAPFMPRPFELCGIKIEKELASIVTELPCHCHNAKPAHYMRGA
jgi:hypothetical protein